ncbi:metallophosphoesterase [Halalkalibacillus sediminis]|uniref:Metallophosphoesterase n=1 Tax=Halalkalibacillus sediminis TaxID=2018042 RepID=A0A2I0QVU5_9BACI|nr:metallophosphoesterase [Halalkalibacillus sediminis]PKR78463.1 metallophosphoesterase [Halalkalibacillus sediminis]
MPKQKKISRRSFLNRLTLGTLGFFGISFGGYYYAREIEPYWLYVNRSNIQSEKIPESLTDFKIAQFTDTHIGFHYHNKELEDVVHSIQNETPDLIVFTGDLFDDPSLVDVEGFEEVVRILQKLDAPFGKYWVYGNHDHGGYGSSKIDEVMQQSGFKLLKNESTIIGSGDNTFTLTGLDDILLGSPNMRNVLPEEREEHFNIILCHEPDFAEVVKVYPFDVQLSGHSHGGQIQLPIIGNLVAPPLGERYVEGHFTLGNRPLQLFVSRGIGTTRLPFRFLCRPEINVYTLKSN